MDELYAAIEKKIKESGYPRKISGADVYDDIVTRLRGKKMEAIFCFPDLRMM